MAHVNGGRADGGREAYEAKLRDTAAILRGESPLRCAPEVEGGPQQWHLGSSSGSIRLAAELGVSYALSLFHSPLPPPAEVLNIYRDAFVPCASLSAPRASVAVAVACGETEQAAQETDRLHGNPLGAHRVVGTPRQCCEQIEALAERYGVSEVSLLYLCQSYEGRRATIEMMASEFALTTQAQRPGQTPSPP